ncbi:MAG: MotA/TolQ/ExbB proton channel family protein [Planctomycetota bacterium]|nr:MotA/TolQ/ExbB proton channel family protein [Planctomycetota bacterium]
MRLRFSLALAFSPFFAGTARADEVSLESALSVFTLGGPVMWVILAVAVVGLAFAIERLFVIRRNAQLPRRLMDRLRDAMVSGGVSAGLRTLEGDGSAMGRVMRSLLSRSGATRRELENAVDDEASRILFDLRANLRPIGVVASLAPMLGLMGTVFGLIAAFRAAAELGMDDPRNFAAGIYEALYTTAWGLIVATPMLIFYHILRGRADSIMREVEERALAFISAASNRASRRHRSDRAGTETDVSGRDGQERDSRPEDGKAAEPEDMDDPLADSEETQVSE